MYSIRQFRPSLYLLLIVGISGFCLAARLPGLWVLSVVAMGAHYWLQGQGVLRPLPSWAAALVALGFGLITLRAFMNDTGSQLMVAGQFLVLLQLVKLYQEGSQAEAARGRLDFRDENRNYAWLLALSLLLMVAAAISTASLLFGVVFVGWLFLSLYCCLLFHLKAETETLRTAMTLPKDVASPAVLRQDERMLPSSMRRLTGLVAFAGLVCAVLVFVFFPRGPGAGLLGNLNLRQTVAMTGFSEQVSFESVARITQSRAVAAYVQLFVDGEELKGGRSLYLRGLTLDTYSGPGLEIDGSTGTRRSPPWQWSRSSDVLHPLVRAAAPGEREDFSAPGEREIVQKIRLEPTGVGVLFAVDGLYALTLDRPAAAPPGGEIGREIRIAYARNDETVRVIEQTAGALQYTAYSRGEIGFRTAAGDRSVRLARHEVRSNIDPRIREYAMRPEVSGVDGDGRALARQRGSRRGPSPVDERIARAVESHLQSAFAYTLDLTDTTRTPGQDPIVQFLYDTRRGHCEYFAGAMVLLLQSLDIDARMVTGFRSEEYNTMVGRYVVRQSDAHAWVEVRVGEGQVWKTFDPTSSNLYAAARAETYMGRLRRLFDYLEYTWADTVVAYDRERRDSLLAGVQRSLTEAANSAQRGADSWDTYLPNPAEWWISPKLVGAVIGAIFLVGVGAVGYYLWERLQLRRRADRIGLDTDLPGDDRLRLARQLAFYDDLLNLLAQRGITRPKHLTPLEFARTLQHLPAGTYSAVHQLTRIYYRIRYGRAALTPAYQRRVRDAVTRLEPTLPPARVQ